MCCWLGFVSWYFHQCLLEVGPVEGAGVKAHGMEGMRAACVAAQRTEALAGREVTSQVGAQHLVPACSLGLLPLKKKRTWLGPDPGKSLGGAGFWLGGLGSPKCFRTCSFSIPWLCFPWGCLHSRWEESWLLAAPDGHPAAPPAMGRVSPVLKSWAELCEPEMGLRAFLSEMLSPRGKEGGLGGRIPQCPLGALATHQHHVLNDSRDLLKGQNQIKPNQTKPEEIGRAHV